MMKKMLLYFCFFCAPLLAYDFKACIKKSQLSLEPIGNSFGIAIKPLKPNSNNAPSKSVLFYYSPTTPPKGYTILKHDPFIGMYLVESKKKLTPLQILPITPQVLEEELASITPKNAVSGKISTRMQSPRKFATLNTPTFANSLITTICDHVYGIGIGNGQFIEKAYLDRFIQSPSIYYGDIGIRVVDKNNAIQIRTIDPFFADNPFLYDDEIIAINNQPITNTDDFDRLVFDLKEGQSIPVKIKREGMQTEVMVRVQKRLGGMLLPENYLKRVGIAISSNFTITQVSADAKNGFDLLKVGDQVLRVNQQPAPFGYDGIIKLLGQYPDMPQKWLISRNGFQFFLMVNQKQVHEDTPFSF